MIEQAELNYKKGLLTNDEITLSTLRDNRKTILKDLEENEKKITLLTNKILGDFETL